MILNSENNTKTLQPDFEFSQITEIGDKGFIGCK